MVKPAVASILTLALSLLVGQVWALNPISIKGTRFFDSVTQDQFFIKGVAYQPRTLAAGFTDPLSKPADCKRDFSLMKDLGLNTIRVYQVRYQRNSVTSIFFCSVDKIKYRSLN